MKSLFFRLLFLLCFARLARSEELAFLPLEKVLEDPAWTLTHCPLVERAVTFESGTLLHSKTHDDQVRLIYITFLERRLNPKALPAAMRAEIVKNVVVDYKMQVAAGWWSVVLLEASHPQRREPQRWLVHFMREGVVIFEPAAQLYDPSTEKTGGSKFYQTLDGEEAKGFSLVIRSEKFRRIIGGVDPKILR